MELVWIDQYQPCILSFDCKVTVQLNDVVGVNLANAVHLGTICIADGKLLENMLC